MGHRASSLITDSATVTAWDLSRSEIYKVYRTSVMVARRAGLIDTKHAVGSRRGSSTPRRTVARPDCRAAAARSAHGRG